MKSHFCEVTKAIGYCKTQDTQQAWIEKMLNSTSWERSLWSDLKWIKEDLGLVSSHNWFDENNQIIKDILLTKNKIQRTHATKWTTSGHPTTAKKQFKKVKLNTQCRHHVMEDTLWFDSRKNATQSYEVAFWPMSSLFIYQ